MSVVESLPDYTCMRAPSMYDICVLCLHLKKVSDTRSVNTAGSASDSLLTAAGPCNDYESLVTISALKRR